MANEATPIGNWIVVKPHKPEERKSAGGLALPDSTQAKCARRGTVVAVGDLGESYALLRSGDAVLFAPGVGVDDGEGNLILDVSTDVYARIQ